MYHKCFTYLHKLCNKFLLWKQINNNFVTNTFDLYLQVEARRSAIQLLWTRFDKNTEKCQHSSIL